MSILLTGGCGYIGSHTAVAMIEAGYDIVIADDFRNCSRLVPERIRRITGVLPRTVEADVCSREDMEALFSRENIEGVIHFAGLKAVGESVAKPVEYYRDNLDSTLTLLETMLAHGCKNIVFSSSATVYGNGVSPFTENSPVTDSTNPYGRSKIMNERILEDAARAHGLSAVLLRYFNPVGAHPSGLIGEEPNGIPNNLMPYVSQVAVGIREKLSVFGNDYPTPDGTGVRDYIHIMDLARGHVKALQYAEGNTGCVAVNLGTGRGVSVLELVHAYERASGVKIPYEIAPRRPGDIAECWSDPSFAEELLGWKAELDLDDMCRDAWKWQSSSGNE